MIRSLQVCRGAAALLVVLLHTSEGIMALPKYFASRPLGHLFAFGGAGVDFFFVLSGFIIAHVHWDDVGKTHRLRAYCVKRLTRIYPAYWAALVPMLIVLLVAPNFDASQGHDPLSLVCSALLLPMAEGKRVLGVSWSLVYEMLFYTLFAILVASRRWGALVSTAWLVLVAACLTGRITTFPWTFLGSVYNLEFVGGVLLALAVKRYRIPLPRTMLVAGVALFLATGLLEDYVEPARTLGHIAGYTVGSLLILAGAIQADRSAVVKPPRLLVFLGDASYSIYLVHFPALSALAKAAKAVHLDAWMPALMLFVVLAACATLAGCLFHVAVERPLLRWFRPAAARGVALEAVRRRAA